MSTTLSSSDHRRNNFDGLRLLLALAVIAGHQYRPWQWAGDAAVLAFFVISGGLVSTSWWADPHPARFLSRRFLRIWPALALVVVVSAAAAWLLASGPWKDMEQLAAVFYLRNLWLHGFDWSFFPWRPPGMNGSLWMLPYEVDLYVALALVGMSGRRGVLVVAALVFLAAVFAAPPAAQSTWLGGAWSVYFAGFFCAGALFTSHPWLQRRTVLVVAGVAALACVVADRTAAAQLLLIPPVIMTIGPRSWPVLRSLARHGDLSYGVYLWGWPVQQVVRGWLGPGAPLALQLAVVLPLAVACAWVSWHLVEKRALRLKRWRAQKVQEPVAA